MKRFLLAILLCIGTGALSLAQQAPSDAPATKEDVQKYLEVMHSHEMMLQMVDAMTKPMQQMFHEQYLKDKDKLPPDFEERMSKMIDDQMRSFPWDEMLQSMVPVYQKHFTKGDIAALIAFYSTPTGQKVLHELPGVMAEAMQSMMPLLRKQMDAMQQRMQQEFTAMINIKNSKGPAANKQPATPN